MTNVIETIINDVNNGRSSIYSKEDVLKILNEVKANNSNVANPPFNYSHLKTHLENRMKSFVRNLDVSDVVNMSSVEFQIRHGNEINFDETSIDVEHQTLTDNIMEEINEVFEEVFPEPGEE